MNTLVLFYCALATVLAYLLGSLSFAVIVSRVMGLQDPRTFGSKNPGATNVLRSGSKLAAIATLVLDALKAWLPVVLVQWFGAPYGLQEGTQALVGLAAFLGHLYPVFFRFAGGKGVATALGVVLATSGYLGLATLITWLVVLALSRYVSLASVLAGVFAPLYYAFGSVVAWHVHQEIFVALVIMGALLIWRHRQNMVRLLQGTESQIGKAKKNKLE